MGLLSKFLCIPCKKIKAFVLAILVILLPGLWSGLAPAGSVLAQIDVPEPEPEPITLSRGALGPITGANPWVWLLCKYSDDASEPFNVAYFQDMITQLNNHFLEASYNLANINGSSVVSHWYSLPSAEVVLCLRQ